MKKTVLVCLFGSLVFSCAFAMSDYDLSEVCFSAGQKKVLIQAEAYGCSIDIDQIEANGVDNRWYNPSKYIWYQAMGDCNGSDRVITIVQYSGGKCF
jgi:hypothetical protein